METGKARERRIKEGFFDRYLLGSGIDIGVGRVEHAGDGEDKVTPECRGWDKDDGDATFMAGVQNATYDWVHCAPAGQRVCTIDGWKPIETVKPGMRVLGKSGFVRVVRTMKIATSQNLFSIAHAHGVTVVTGNHPIAVPGDWLDADKLGESNEVLCVPTNVEPSDLVNGINVSLRVASPATARSFFSRPIAVRHSSSAKLRHDFRLPFLTDEKWANDVAEKSDSFVPTFQNNPVVVLGSGGGLFGRTRPCRATAYSSQDVHARRQDGSVAVDDLHVGLHRLSDDADPNASFAINDPCKPPKFFWSYVHKITSMQFYGEVFHLETDDGTFFIEGLLTHNSSHCLEHIPNPWKALRNWFRILKPGGCLALLLPHRDLYEQRRELPSLWNQDHKHFYMPFFHELPDTLGLAQLIAEALEGRDYRMLYVKECSDGYDWSLQGKAHAVGEYSIEAVVMKL